MSSHATDELLQNSRLRSNADTPQEVQNVPGAQDWDDTSPNHAANNKTIKPLKGDFIAAMKSPDGQTVMSV